MEPRTEQIFRAPEFFPLKTSHPTRTLTPLMWSKIGQPQNGRSGKWNQGLEPAVHWWEKNIDPHPHGVAGGSSVPHKGGSEMELLNSLPQIHWGWG